ncbi:MAG: hypothetical protein QXW86_05515 [Saccharolobus sp.]|uniref:hypothetical protein n=1 Tax=Saccharolobus sp. TaxID=2100761 RepID=UPI0031799DCD
MIDLHTLIKFWSRKEPSLIFREIDKAELICDPFCGSGTSGLSAVFKGASAFLSDINPVSIFIAYNSLNGEILEDETIKAVKELCWEIEKEVYTLDSSRVVNFAVWKTNYKCPSCGQKVNSITSSKVYCEKCGRMLSINDLIVDEKIVSLKFLTKGNSKDAKLIKSYSEIEDSLKIDWYPKGEFIYPATTIKFKNGPHRPIEIKDLFTKRNLYVASKLYQFIEKIWNEDQAQGDLLKFAFIASLANATKMMPHARSSGPSWKIPRYWIPPLREERNFCRSFIKRVERLVVFKKRWSPLISNYKVTVAFHMRLPTTSGKFIHICKADALEIYQHLPKVDVVILDPPHYDEINYFELTYLWQKWLEGKSGDKRFTDYDYWKDEICVNKRIGKDLKWYNTQLHRVINCYINCLHKGGKILLILHNKDRNLLNSTVKEIKEGVEGKIEIGYSFPRIPSSAQGLHGHRKYLCLIKIRH